jgi:hypothetical protein
MVIGAMGCETRDRLILDEDPDPTGDGPVTTIDRPGQDTTVAEGPAFFVNGLVTDPTGIDTIYFDTEGGISAFPPEVNAGTSFRFGLPITTNDLSGTVITVRVYATDIEGHRGDTAIRVLTVQ